LVGLGRREVGDELVFASFGRIEGVFERVPFLGVTREVQKRFARFVVDEYDQVGLPSLIEESLALGRTAARGRWDGDDTFGIDGCFAGSGRFLRCDGRSVGWFD